MKSNKQSESSLAKSKAEEMAENYAMQFWPVPIRNEAKEQFLAGMQAMLEEAEKMAFKIHSDSPYVYLLDLKKLMGQDG